MESGGIIYDVQFVFVCFGATAPHWAKASSFTTFLDHIQRRTAVGSTPLDERLARRRRPLPDNTQRSQRTDIHAPGGIRTHNLSRRAATDLRLRPRGH